MLGTPGYLPMPGLLAVKKMIANARKSAMPRRTGEEERAVRQNFQGETAPEGDVPKAVARLTKRRSPNRHCWKKQTLNTSKSISGTDCAGDGSEFAQESTIS